MESDQCEKTEKVNVCNKVKEQSIQDITTNLSNIMDLNSVKDSIQHDIVMESTFQDEASVSLGIEGNEENNANITCVLNKDNNHSDETCTEHEKMDYEHKVKSKDISFPPYTFNEFIEISKTTKPFNLEKFLVGCKWSPDGTCLLCNCADYTLRIFDLPNQLYNKQFWNKGEHLPELVPALKISEGGQIYDYDWYPFMSSWSPESCCLLSTSSKAPVHLWDAYTGNLRGTYRGYNRVDETDNAISVKFSLNGEKIYCGYKNEIKVFDVSVPGRDCTSIDTKHVAGQTGLISCIAENPTVPNMYAAGSYKRTIGLYLDSGDNIGLLNGQRAGVTHIMWSYDGICLFSGGRKDKEILCWDMRNLGEVLYTLERTVDTNQRIYFDLTPDGNYLISGNTTGEITVWDLTQTTDVGGKMNSTYKFQSHLDCANGVSIHRQLPLLATSSGQHHFPDLTSDDDDNNFFDVKKMITRMENSIKLWWIGPLQDEQS